MIEKIPARSRLYFPNTSISMSKVFDFFTLLENGVEGRSVFRKSYAAAEWVFLEEMKDLETKSLCCLLMTSHCTSKNTTQGKAWSLLGNCVLGSHSTAVHTCCGADFDGVINLINFLEIAPVCGIKPALMTFAKFGLRFPVELSKLGAQCAS